MDLKAYEEHTEELIQLEKENKETIKGLLMNEDINILEDRLNEFLCNYEGTAKIYDDCSLYSGHYYMQPEQVREYLDYIDR